MRKIHLVVTCILLTFLFCVCGTGISAFADTTESNMCTVTFTVANAQSINTFTDNISISLKDTASNEEHQYALTKQNNYSAQYLVPANSKYSATLSIKNSKDFSIANADGSEISTYSIPTNTYSINWIIKPTNQSSAADSATSSKTNASSQTQTDTNSGKDILSAYLKKVSFMETDPKYKSFLAIYSGQVFKQYYLNADNMNTGDSWNKMSNYERFNYYITFEYPQTLLMGVNPAKNKDEFIDNLSSTKRLLSNINSNDTVYNAILNVWDWHWTNYDSSRKFINLYEGINPSSLTSGSPVSSKSAVNSVNSTIDNLTNGNTVLEVLKRNIVSIILLLIIGAGLIFIYVKKKKNEAAKF